MDKEYTRLINEARRAIGKGFYAAKVPQKRYGAAVLTEDGTIYSAGQYSSFNHITSIHAEMGAIIIATMNGEPNIIALALSSSSKDSICSCGACLQFIKEHSMRTGIDIKLIYDNDETTEIAQSSLTSCMW